MSNSSWCRTRGLHNQAFGQHICSVIAKAGFRFTRIHLEFAFFRGCWQLHQEESNRRIRFQTLTTAMYNDLDIKSYDHPGFLEDCPDAKEKVGLSCSHRRTVNADHARVPATSEDILYHQGLVLHNQGLPCTTTGS